jgi:hypothetical protein
MISSNASASISSICCGRISPAFATRMSTGPSASSVASTSSSADSPRRRSAETASARPPAASMRRTIWRAASRLVP